MENSEEDRVYKDALDKMMERRGTVSLFTNEQLKAVEDNENYTVGYTPHLRAHDMKSDENKRFEKVKAEKIEKFSAQMNKMAALLKEGRLTFSKEMVSQ